MGTVRRVALAGEANLARNRSDLRGTEMTSGQAPNAKKPGLNTGNHRTAAHHTLAVSTGGTCEAALPRPRVLRVPVCGLIIAFDLSRLDCGQFNQIAGTWKQ